MPTLYTPPPPCKPLDCTLLLLLKPVLLLQPMVRRIDPPHKEGDDEREEEKDCHVREEEPGYVNACTHAEGMGHAMYGCKCISISRHYPRAFAVKSCRPVP